LEMEAALSYIGKFLSGYAVSHLEKTVFFIIAVLKSQIYLCFRDQRLNFTETLPRNLIT
jgi:predicted cation transporter